MATLESESPEEIRDRLLFVLQVRLAAARKRMLGKLNPQWRSPKHWPVRIHHDEAEELIGLLLTSKRNDSCMGG